MPPASWRSLAEDALRRIAPHRTKLLINSRLDVALAVGAGGIHLTSADLSAGQVRTVAAMAGGTVEGRKFLVAVSCHSSSEVRLAAQQGADFVVLAPIFEKILAPAERATQARAESRLPGIGCDAIGEAGRGASVPILALGGVTLANAASCLAAGAAGVAAIRLFQEGDLPETIRRLRATRP